MKDTTNTDIMINRIIAFIAGGLLVFAVMSFTTVSSIKKNNTELTKALDLSQYEAGRLLKDAKEQFENKDFKKAMTSLKTLFDKQPGSAETVEGKVLLTVIESAETSLNEKWEAALPMIRSEWISKLASEIRAKSDEERAVLENEMDTKMEKEWDKAMAAIRAEWEKQL